jgi:hypothetical protein
MKDQIDQAMRRAQRYWHIDGLTEIAFAWIFLILGLYFYLSATQPQGTLLSTLIDSSLFLIVLAGAFLSGKLVSYVKERVTYPRTGYVSYQRKSGANRWIAMGIAMLMGGIMGGLIDMAPASLNRMTAYTGFFLAIPLLVLGFRSGSWRFYLLCIVSLGLGLGLSLTGHENTLGLSYYYLLLSLAMFISGGLTFLIYLRKTTPPEEDSISAQRLHHE